MPIDIDKEAISRRINYQHRLVYQVMEDEKIIKIIISMNDFCIPIDLTTKLLEDFLIY